MMKQIENEGNSILNVFPLRNDIISKYIRVDTTTLVHLLLRKEQGNKSEYLFKGNLKRFEDKIWKFFFRTERKCFTKKHYTFHHMIETDGIGCSILLLRNDLIGKRVNMKRGLSNEKYIDELEKTELKELQNKKIVGIDPGLGSLIYCVDSDNKDANVFQYTQESKSKGKIRKKNQKFFLG